MTQRRRQVYDCAYGIPEYAHQIYFSYQSYSPGANNAAQMPKKVITVNKTMRACIYPNCRTICHFNYNGYEPIYCVRHRIDGMIDVRDFRCKGPCCSAAALWNYPDRFCKRYCEKHKRDGMIDITLQLCGSYGCGNEPTHNWDHDFVPLYCFHHAQPGMIDITARLCSETSCYRIPYFGIDRPTHCEAHAPSSMQDLRFGKCFRSGCSSPPTVYDTKRKIVAYCDEHQKYRHNTFRQCERDGCTTYASYNYLGSIPMYCFKHKERNMVNTRAKQCIEPQCDNTASYNIKGKRPLYCGIHRRENMVNTKGIICLANSCRLRASFNYPGCSPSIYCKRHSHAGMICIRARQKAKPPPMETTASFVPESDDSIDIAADLDVISQYLNDEFMA